MGFSAVGLQLAGGAMSAAGARNQALGQKQMLNAEATIDDWQAEQALRVGQNEAETSQLRTAAAFGQQRANLAANGVDLGSGSALDVLATTKYLGKRDAATIYDNATRSAWAYRTEAGFKRAGAKAISPNMAAATSLLGSAGTVASSWYTLNKQGAFT